MHGNRTRERPDLPRRVRDDWRLRAPAGGAYPAGVNFVVCPYDGTQLRALRGPAVPARPLLMTCPTCQKQFRLADGKAVEVAPGGNDGQV